jgi:amino acid adenylation domain-containing protein
MYMLTSNQRSIWFDQLLHSGSGLYNIGGYVCIKGELDVSIFKQVIQHVVLENEALRLVFISEEGEPIQKIKSNCPVELNVLDFTDNFNASRACLDWMTEESEKAIDPSLGENFRFSLLKSKNECHYWHIKQHHLNADGWSISKMVQLVSDSYNTLINGQPLLTGNCPSYLDHVEEDQRYLHSDQFKLDQVYWQNKYAKLPPSLPIGNKGFTTGSEKIKSQRKSFIVKNNVYSNLTSSVQAQRLNNFHVVLGLIYTYLSRTSGNQDMVIGLPILNRGSKKFKNTLGLFAGIVPLRIESSGSLTFYELVLSIKQRLKETFRHQRFPINEIIKDSMLVSGRNESLFNVVLSFEKHDYDVNFGSSKAYSEALPNNQEKTPLAIYIREYKQGEDIKIDLDFNLKHWDEFYMNQFSKHFEYMFETIAENLHEPISTLNLFSQEDSMYQIEEWNNYKGELSTQCIHEIFEEKVKLFPKNTALRQGAELMSYEELNNKANRLAHYLLKNKLVQRNEIVGLIADRSFNTVIGMLAVLKAGGAYLPLDPNYPEDRLVYMVSDSGISLLLKPTFNQFESKIKELSIEEIISSGGKNSNPIHINEPGDLCYVIYTSGSTGKPKGVMVKHEGFVNMILEQIQYTSISENDNCLLFSSLSFDSSASEIYQGLLTGSSLTIANDGERKNPDLFTRLLLDQKITILTITPSYLSLIPTEAFLHVKTLFTGGESVVEKDVKRLAKVCNYVNVYGPTENSVCSTMHKCSAELPSGSTIPIGRPLGNTHVFILDSEHNLLPIGSIGEMYLAGKGLATGYLNNPELTQERFIPCPFSSGKMYRTGDLARYNEHGEIEFLGRTDDQVKLRGHRIELGEIEQVALRHEKMLEVTVVIHTDQESEKSLVLYYGGEEKVSAEELREYLNQFLPEFMLPNHYIHMTRLPITPNGKIDRKKLSTQKPQNESNASSPGRQSKTEMEGEILQIWQELLGQHNLGVDSHFFTCGGHSLKAAQFISRFQKETGIKLQFSDVFQHPTIVALAKIATAKQPEVLDSIKVISPRASYPLTSTQQRVWFAEELNENEQKAFNIPVLIRLKQHLELKTIEGIIQEIVTEEEALRIVFDVENSLPVQKIQAHTTLNLEEFDLKASQNSQSELSNIADSFTHHAFDLRKGPLFKVGHITYTEEAHYLIFSFHHIISDGWSVDLFLRKMDQKLSDGIIQSSETPVSDRLTFKDYIVWNENYATSQQGQKDREYWLNKLGEASPLDLPTDYPRGTERNFQGAVHSVFIQGKMKDQLESWSHQKETSLFMVLLSCVKILLTKLTKQDDILVGTPVSGRNKIETESIFGMFVNTLGLRDRVENLETVESFVSKVTQTTLEGIEHQEYAFDKLLMDLNVQTDGSHHPLFDVLVTIEDQMIQNQGQFYTFQDELISELISKYSVSKFDLSFSFKQTDDLLQLNLVYNTDLYTDQTIALYADYFNFILSQITENPSVLVGDVQLSHGTESSLIKYLGLPVEEVERVYPLTAVQRDMYLTSIRDPKGSAMRPLAYFVLDQHVDEELWEDSLKEISKHEEALRTKLIEHPHGLYQAVWKKESISFKFLDYSQMNIDPSEYDQLVHDLAEKDQDVKKNLVDHYLVKISEDIYITVLSAHHILIDGISFSKFYETLDLIYHGLIRKETILRRNYTAPFHSFAQKIQDRFDSREVLNFWTKHLSGVQPLSYQGALSIDNRNVSDHIIINQDRSQSIQAYCRKNNLRSDIYFKAIYALLVKTICSTEASFCLRENNFGRTKSIMHTLGCFMSTKPVLIELGDSRTFLDFCQQLKEESITTKGQSQISISLQNRLIGEENVSFYYNYQKFLEPKTELNLGILHQLYHVLEGQVEIRIAETKNGFELKLDYQEHHFNGNDFLNRLINLSDQLIGGVKELHQLNFITEEEQYKFDHEFNQEAVVVPDTTIVGLFERQVQLNPSKTAIVCEEKHISYEQLKNKSDQIGWHLTHSHGIQKGDFVAIVADRNEWMIIALLGVLKSGAAYIPIDSDLPSDRIDYIVENSQAKLIIQASSIPHMDQQQCPVFHVESLGNESVAFEPVSLDKDSSAYIIYTSGTTGKPKGVLVNHNSLSNIADGWRKAYELDQFEVCLLQMVNFSFDVFTGDIIRALTNGGKLIICPKETRLDPENIYTLLAVNEVNILETTPALAVPFMEYVYQKGLPMNFMRLLILGSDSLATQHYKTLYERFGDKIRILNSYGVTEATIDSSYFEGETQYSVKGGNTPIGRPLQNTWFEILTDSQQRVPIGVFGELYIGGSGVAVGYFRNPALTNEKFSHSRIGKQTSKWYKTGDMVRWLPDGNLEFQARRDDQVKIRGFRIELKEIESVMLENQDMDSVVVHIVTSPDGEKEIAAYFTAQYPLELPHLKTSLLEKLPRYMLPSYFVQLDHIPLTANGKVDKKALPGIEGSLVTDPYEKANSETEIQLIALWKKLLGRDLIGRNDGFFELGGHSLKVTALSSEIYRQFRCEIPLTFLFKNSKVHEIATYIDEHKTGSLTVIEKAPMAEYYPLSSAQMRLYLMQEMEPDSTAYNMPAVFTISGNWDKEILFESLQKLVDRHEILRTSFHSMDGSPVQVIHPHALIQINDYAVDEDTIESVVKKFVEPFDLSMPCLFRAQIAIINTQEVFLMVDMHHIVSDGLTVQILVKELAELYSGKSLPKPSIQYKDFTLWQKEQFQLPALQKQKEYWLSSFKDIPVLDLPCDFQRQTVKTYHGDRISLLGTDEWRADIEHYVQKNHVTFNQFLTSVFAVLLQRYARTEDLVIGTPISGRCHPELESVTGMFVNTLPLRFHPRGEMTFGDFLTQSKSTLVSAIENQEYPFELLINDLNIERDRSRSPLFDVMFSYLKPEKKNLELGEANIESVTIQNNIAKFDILLEVIDLDSHLEFHFEYNTDLFKASTIQRFANHYNQLVRSIVVEQNQALHAYDMLNESERKWLLSDQNSTASYPENESIHSLFENKVKQHPNKVALRYSTETLTYQELNDRTNQLAREIQEKTLDKKNAIVAILQDRSIDMVVSILAILKSGHAYLPIDPTYPQDRIDYMLSDSEAVLVISQSNLSPLIKPGMDQVYTDQMDFTPVDSPNLNLEVSPLDLAYIIYTSGSTGKPKGVMIEHRNVVRLMINDEHEFKFSENDVWTMFHSYCFDFSVWEMYGALLYGGELLLVSKEMAQNTPYFLNFLAENKVTVLNQTPSSFYNLIPLVIENKLQLSLRYVIFGGEALKPGKLKLWKEHYPECYLINMYGITETTVHVTFKEITQQEIVSNISNIGKPISTLSMYVLDDSQHLLPIGAPGELCIGGLGVARGYLNREALTNERFVDNPFEKGQKLYRSGDLACILENGDFEYLGRIDHQVKIRGYRIELGEIESKLLAHPFIDDAYVMDREDETGIKYLCAYVVRKKHSEDEDQLNDLSAQLKIHLSELLPDYMVPAWIVSLDALPLTGNGKVNRSLLDNPISQIHRERPVILPVNDNQKLLIEIWKEVLKVNLLGISDRFFDVGGHSLIAVQLCSKIHEQFGVNLPLKIIFSNPDIEKLEEHISCAKTSSEIEIKPAKVMELYPASSAERRLFILNQLDKKGTSYNIPGIFEIQGDFDLEKFEFALKTLIHRHEILRTSFLVKDEEIHQKIHTEFCFKIQDLRGITGTVEEQIESFIRPFDLEKAPLLRVAYLEAENKTLLLFDIHHIIADGLSMEIIIHEVSQIYEGKKLPSMPIQYKDFSVWQREQVNTAQFQNQKKYWIDRFEGDIPILDMPTDFIRPAIKSFNGGRHNFKLALEDATRIKNFAKETSTTPFNVFLTAYAIVLAKYSGQEDIVIGTPVAGRKQSALNQLIGMFVNTLPLRNTVSGELSVIDLIHASTSVSIDAFENQDYPLEELLEELDLKRDMSRNPLFDFMFSYQHQNVDSMEIQTTKLIPHPFDLNNSKMDVTLDVIGDSDGTYLMSLEFATRVFRKDTIKRFSEHYKHVLNLMMEQPHSHIKDLSITSEREQVQLLQDFNNTLSSFPRTKSIAQLFKEQVKRSPKNMAITSGGIEMSYLELDRLSDKMSNYLISKGVGHQDRIGLSMNRSPEALISILGILKIGATYVFVDPKHPLDRMAYILKDSTCLFLIVNTTLPNKPIELDSMGMSSIEYSDILLSEIDIMSPEPLKPQKNDLAYIIYTSGTTGHPKGVAVSEKSVINLSYWFDHSYDLEQNKNVLQMTNLAFDVSIEETLVPLMNGAYVHILPQDKIFDKAQFYDFIVQKQIHIAQFVPSTLQGLLVENDFMPSLKIVICGGEKLELALKENILTKGYELYNHYGPTETTVDAISWKCSGHFSRLIPKRFEEIALKHPERVALESQDQTITYGRLNELAEGLAFELQNKGVGPDVVVGIMSGRNIELILGILAIMKAGGAYLPLDPTIPAERLEYMLQDSEAKLLLLEEKFMDQLHFSGEKQVLKQDKVKNPTKKPRHTVLSTTNLAYVIYTSGSTGNPKGVQIEHGALNNFLQTISTQFTNGFGKDDVCTGLTSISFDVSVCEIFTPLINGSKLLLLDRKDVYDVASLGKTIHDKKVTFAYIPPSLLNDVCDQLDKYKTTLLFNKLMVGVEPVIDHVLQKYLGLHDNMQVINSYGPTESTIYCSSYEYKASETYGAIVPIGKPIFNTQIYILDKNNHLQPIGVPGELCIGGEGLARGYLNNPELTREKFTPNPFMKGKKIYRTGDLAKWLPDGNIEFIGRKDFQVKIRGFRIEPGEIESKIMEHTMVKQALVQAKTNPTGEKYLCAYVTLSGSLEINELRDSMKVKLPDYMVPSFFVVLDQFPLTKNEKIDRKALPDPEVGELGGSREIILPDGPVEEQIYAYWKEVLGKPQVGVTENFFEIGGNSLKIIQLFSKIDKAYEGYLGVNDLFDKPTIKQQAQQILEKLEEKSQPSEEKKVTKPRRVKF